MTDRQEIGMITHIDPLIKPYLQLKVWIFKYPRWHHILWSVWPTAMKLARWRILTLWSLHHRHFEDRLIAISRQRFYRCPRNLARWHTL